MATKIRLQRHGKKSRAFYHIVAADSRSPRDGKFIEKLGTYNPNTNPATIELEFDRTLHWVQVGAEMTDTARALLSYKGILFKNHLLKGVEKGALTVEQVEEKFIAWQESKDATIGKKVEKLSNESTADKASRLKAEADVNEARAKVIAEKNAPVIEVEVATEVEVSSEEATEAPATEEAAEAPATDETPAAEGEEPKA
jgi:small subunit ribosomal protein S16